MATAKKHNVAGFDSRDGGMREAILDAALSFICSTEKDLVLCDEGVDAKREVGHTTWQQIRSRVRDGTASLSCVIDFAYSDGGRLKGGERQLERCFCLHDDQQGHPDELLTVIHAHTTEKWGSRRKLATGRPLSCVTSVNIRHAHKDGVGSFEQEQGSRALKLVPKNKELKDGWRHLPEKEIVWYPGGKGDVPAVPRKDSMHKSVYDEVGELIKIGEDFCAMVRTYLCGCVFARERA